jgi:Fur family peroxide stress response transcriptional regulator
MNTSELIVKLHEKGFKKVTPQRLAICEFVLSSKEHPTVEQVYQAVQKKYPTLSIATVYQTLHLLTEIGMLKELGFRDGVTRYDPDTLPHINIVCQSCGTIQDFTSDAVRTFLLQITQELNRPLMGQHLEIYTVCDQCKKSGPTEKR